MDAAGPITSGRAREAMTAITQAVDTARVMAWGITDMADRTAEIPEHFITPVDQVALAVETPARAHSVKVRDRTQETWECTEAAAMAAAQECQAIQVLMVTPWAEATAAVLTAETGEAQEARDIAE